MEFLKRTYRLLISLFAVLIGYISINLAIRSYNNECEYQTHMMNNVYHEYIPEYSFFRLAGMLMIGITFIFTVVVTGYSFIPLLNFVDYFFPSVGVTKDYWYDSWKQFLKKEIDVEYYKELHSKMRQINRLTGDPFIKFHQRYTLVEDGKYSYAHSYLYDWFLADEKTE